MKGKGCLIIGVIVALLGVVVFWGISKYNSFVPAQENVEAQWANVENTYQKRADLVPNLVNTVKGAANFEQSTLTDVINARAKATSTQVNIDNVDDLTPENIAKFQAAQDQLSGALSRLLVSVEKYPTLTATQNFQSLQAELSSIEQEVLFERKKYNDAARGFNSLIKTFPNNVIANFGNFKEKGYFEATAGAENAPTVNFE
ncbi:LemA family protein [Vaginella massiliensis]|uniref:LemA family protein n=1 Tax=Vaginella massiliensis TaxID=1816680 RepID=UPI000838F656|nr:LemA family protein [Vaginella massiliensis]